MKIGWIICLVMFGTQFGAACGNPGPAPIVTPLDSLQVAEKYCGSCHQFPSPELLDSNTWIKRVLPNMGWRMGIRAASENPYDSLQPDEAILARKQNLYPEKAILTKDEWAAINSFYASHAPKQLREADYEQPGNGLSRRFQADGIYIGQKKAPDISLLSYDEKTALLYVGDAGNNVYAFNTQFKTVGKWATPSPPVAMLIADNQLPEVVCIGSIAPSEKKEGGLYSLNGGQQQATLVAGNLARPVQVLQTDLDKNGVDEVLICAFGHITGALVWWKEGDSTQQKILVNQPGARALQVTDINQDGWPDIVVLMAQAREELLLLLADGRGGFSNQVIASFPPVYGVSYFEMGDLNGDGFADIVVSNGDNWDLSPVRKYYHGLRVLLNDQQNHFKEAQFIPLSGAGKLVMADFDQDGDKDLAAVSFYDDGIDPARSVLLLENDGKAHFTGGYAPNTDVGKWLTMIAADIDRDGDTDIVLGSYFHNGAEWIKLLGQGVETFPSLVVLWNGTVKR